MKTKKLKMPMPSKSDVSARISTINNAFAQSVIPRILEEDQEKLKTYYHELGIKEGQCAYCLKDRASTGDHLRPLIKDKLPTGYLTNISNIVPCCSECNSSKGGKDFEVWYKSNKNLERLKKIGLTEKQINDRYNTITRYLTKHKQKPLNFKNIVGIADWNEFIKRKKQLEKLLNDDKKFCDKLLDKIKKHIQRNKQ